MNQTGQQKPPEALAENCRMVINSHVETSYTKKNHQQQQQQEQSR